MHPGVYPRPLKLMVCVSLGLATMLFAAQAVSSPSALTPSTEKPIIYIKADKQSCWQQCRHLCTGRPRASCRVCVRRCKAQAARILAVCSNVWISGAGPVTTICDSGGHRP